MLPVRSDRYYHGADTGHSGEFVTEVRPYTVTVTTEVLREVPTESLEGHADITAVSWDGEVVDEEGLPDDVPRQPVEASILEGGFRAQQNPHEVTDPTTAFTSATNVRGS